MAKTVAAVTLSKGCKASPTVQRTHSRTQAKKQEKSQAKLTNFFKNFSHSAINETKSYGIDIAPRLIQLTFWHHLSKLVLEECGYALRRKPMCRANDR